MLLACLTLPLCPRFTARLAGPGELGGSQPQLSWRHCPQDTVLGILSGCRAQQLTQGEDSQLGPKWDQSTRQLQGCLTGQLATHQPGALGKHAAPT